jgi:flavodoxin
VGIVIGVIAALIAIGVLLYKNWDKIKEYAGIVKDCVVKTWTQLKTSVTNIFNAIKTTVTTVWTNIKTSISNVVTGIKTAIKNAFTSAKNTVSNIFNTIRTIAVGAWTGIKYAITHPIDAAVLAVKLAISKIKGFFSNLSLKLPHIKLPHFKLSGKLSLAPPSVPKLSIDWYKNGGIFTQPTIFGGVGVGEAGAEAVLPLKKLWEEMDKRFMPQDNIVINVYGSQNMNVNQLAEEVQRRLVQLQRQKAKAF